MNHWEWLTGAIPEGQREAVSMTYLANLFGLSRREIRREIESARRAGVLICSSNQGYFMPETMDEISEYVRIARARIRTSRECLAPFVNEIRKAEGMIL